MKGRMRKKRISSLFCIWNALVIPQEAMVLEIKILGRVRIFHLMDKVTKIVKS